MTRAPGWLLGLSLLVPSGIAGAQDWRTTESARQLHDSGAYAVRVKYSAGQLNLAPAASPMLYRMSLHYDADRGRAIHTLDDGRTLTLGLDQATSLRRASRRGEESRMNVELSPAVPMALVLELGAARANLELGDLALTSLRIDAGASDTRVKFSTPNRLPMREIALNSGAANVELFELANANAAAIDINAGVGNVELDFGGTWTRDVVVTVDLAVGAMQLTVPRDVGIRLEVGRLLTRVSTEGLVARDGGFVSENWETATHKITARIKTVLGTVDVKRSAR